MGAVENLSARLTLLAAIAFYLFFVARRTEERTNLGNRCVLRVEHVAYPHIRAWLQCSTIFTSC